MNYHKITINPEKITSLEDTNPLLQLSLAEKFAECIVDILNNYKYAEYDAKVVTTEVWGHEFANIVKFKGDLSELHLEFIKAFCPHIHISYNWYWEAKDE
tara:strand:- start:17846 stop:18145 length:300 start_codon:yes stop_codon:yes gene_type:complete